MAVGVNIHEVSISSGAGSHFRPGTMALTPAESEPLMFLPEPLSGINAKSSGLK